MSNVIYGTGFEGGYQEEVQRALGRRVAGRRITPRLSGANQESTVFVWNPSSLSYSSRLWHTVSSPANPLAAGG